MQDCTHLSRFALVSRFFPDRYAKKYTGYCIIACVPMWQRVKDSNPHKRSQSPVCYHYTNPLSCACSSDDSRKCIYYYMRKSGNVKKKF